MFAQSCSGYLEIYYTIFHTISMILKYFIILKSSKQKEKQ